MASLPHLLLYARSDSSRFDTKCPATPDGPPITPIVGTLTFTTLSTIVAGVCTLISLLLSLYLIAQHALNYTNPIQQRQIIRIICIVPWISIFSLLIVALTGAGEYMVESLDLGCAVAISCFLLLLCDFVLTGPDGYRALFGVSGQSSSPAWLKRVWYLVLQYIPVSVILWTSSAISHATHTYCPESNSPRFAHIWITILKAVSTGAAIIACLRFYKRQKTYLVQHRVVLKFMAFKGVVGLNFLQNFIINILIGQNVLHPTTHLSHHDLSTALPALLLAIEMPFFALLMVYAFPVTPYKPPQYKPQPPSDNISLPSYKHITKKRSAAGALLEAANFSDVFGAFVRGPMRLVRGLEREEGLEMDGGGEVRGGGRGGGGLRGERGYVRVESEEGERYEGLRGERV